MKIILATDGSGSAENAIRWFSHLPVCRDSQLMVVTVAGRAATSIYSAELDEELGRREKESAERAFTRAATILQQAGYESVHCPRIGHAADEIVQYAREVGADLIVIGARGHSMLSKILLGSTSDSVATHAHCSVLVVRHAEEALRHPAEAVRITLAHDGSASATKAIQQMSQVNWPEGSTISLINVIQRPALLADDIPYDVYLTNAMNEALEASKTELRPHFTNVETRVLEEVHVGGSIINFAKESKADLVVVGDTGQSAISRFFIGSVSRFVLHHADCSVWLIRK
jgi:nucleotide-binding universal stress UspA family protein